MNTWRSLPNGLLTFQQLQSHPCTKHPGLAAKRIDNAFISSGVTTYLNGTICQMATINRTISRSLKAWSHGLTQSELLHTQRDINLTSSLPYMIWYLPPWVVRQRLYVLRSKSVYFSPLRVGSREEAASKNSSMSTGLCGWGWGWWGVRRAGFKLLTKMLSQRVIRSYVHTFLCTCAAKSAWKNTDIIAHVHCSSSYNWLLSWLECGSRT